MIEYKAKKGELYGRFRKIFKIYINRHNII